MIGFPLVEEEGGGERGGGEEGGMREDGLRGVEGVRRGGEGEQGE